MRSLGDHYKLSIYCVWWMFGCDKLVSPISMCVEMSGLPDNNWHHFLRLRDLQQIFSDVPLDGITRVLEIGAGDGVQTDALRERFEEVVSIDISPSGTLNGIIVADVVSLPFVDGYFDLVFSSNVLEHVERLEESLIEMKRVLTKQGIMIHSMPTSTWKVLQVFGRPAASAVKITRKVMSVLTRRGDRSMTSTHLSNRNFVSIKRSLLARVMGQFIPTIHGVSSNHVQEFIQFRTRWWIREFNRVDLACYRRSSLFFHSPYEILPYKFLHLRDRIAKAGLASVQVFWLRL